LGFSFLGGRFGGRFAGNCPFLKAKN
jgi:hypothetical protein